MKRLFYIVLLFCLLVMQTRGQNLVSVDTIVTVKSQLKSVLGDKPISNAHIINPGLSIGTTSDSLGFFSIFMRRDDSLIISVLAFEELHFFLPGFWPSSEYSKTIYIREMAYLIDEVHIHGLGSYEQFKQKVINARPPEPPEERTRQYIDKMATTEAVDWDKTRVGFNFSIKTKEERSQKKLNKILAEIEKRKSIERKFNVQIVGELTGLSGKELERFMEYCNFPEDFLLASSEYLILLSVKRTFERYQKEAPEKKILRN